MELSSPGAKSLRRGNQHDIHEQGFGVFGNEAGSIVGQPLDRMWQRVDLSKR